MKQRFFSSPGFIFLIISALHLIVILGAFQLSYSHAEPLTENAIISVSILSMETPKEENSAIQNEKKIPVEKKRSSQIKPVITKPLPPKQSIVSKDNKASKITPTLAKNIEDKISTINDDPSQVEQSNIKSIDHSHSELSHTFNSNLTSNFMQGMPLSNEPKNIRHLSCANTAPVYPLISRQKEEVGTVIIQIIVDVSGNIEEASIKKSSGYARLDNAAMHAALNSPCLPYRENGRAIRAVTDRPYRFSLND